MTYDHDSAGYEDEEVESSRQSLLSKFSKIFGGFTKTGDESEYYEDETHPVHSEAVVDTPPVARVPAPHRSAGGSLNPIRRGATVTQLRTERERVTSVTVRRTVQSFEDVRRAVDGLLEGIQQIVNIEQTPPDVAERLIDFLNGATYAIDGSVEKIGAQVYLFTPSNVTIDIEDKTRTAAKPFFERE
jgi:cell division inhibitor SepF